MEKMEVTNRDKLIRKGFEKAHYHVMNFIGMYFLPGSRYMYAEMVVAFFGNFVVSTIIVLSGYTMILNVDYMNVFFEACFVAVLLCGVELSVLNFIFHRNNISKLLYAVGCDFFIYDGEENSDEENAALAKFNRYTSKLTKIYSYLIFSNIACYLLLTPFIQFLAGESIEGAYINKKLPILLYFPFETEESTFGYIVASFMEFFTGLFTFFGVIGLDLGCFLMILQLKNQLAILNNKIKTLEIRAMKRMGIDEETSLQKFKGKLWENEEFNRSLWLCLRENIKHHQTIINLYQLLHLTYKNAYLFVMGNGSILIALIGYLLTENPAASIMVKAVVIMATVLIHVFMYCSYGQMFTDQASELQENLYNCPWYNCDRNFKLSLLIMMSMAYRPLELKSNFIKHPLSLDTFTDVVRTAYSFLNLIRQM